MYSYNSSFEKVFKGNSLKTLIRQLKCQKDITETFILDELDRKDSKDEIDIYNQDEDFKNIIQVILIILKAKIRIIKKIKRV